MFFSSVRLWNALSHLHSVYRGYFLEVKLPGLDVVHSSACFPKVKNEWSIPLIRVRVSTAWADTTLLFSYLFTPYYCFVASLRVIHMLYAFYARVRC